MIKNHLWHCNVKNTLQLQNDNPVIMIEGC